MSEIKNENPFLNSYVRNSNQPIMVTANIINIATSPADHKLSELYINMAVMLFFLAENIPMNYLHIKYYSRAIRYVESGLRGSLVRKLQQLSITYHKEMESGRIQSKIMRDVEAIEMLSGQLFVGVLSIGLNLMVAFTVTAAKSFTVFLFFILSIPASVGLIALFRTKIRNTNAQFRKEMETTNAKVVEMVGLIPVTKAHGLQKEEVKKMERQLNTVAEKGYQLDVVQSLFGASNWAVFQLFKLLCLAFTGYLAYRRKIKLLPQTYSSSSSECNFILIALI